MTKKTTVTCPSCFSHYCPVRWTRHVTVHHASKEYVITKRGRVCKHCGYGFTSTEKSVKEKPNGELTEEIYLGEND